MTYLQPLPDWTEPECVVLAIPNNKLVPASRNTIILDYAEYLKSQGIRTLVLCDESDSETCGRLDSIGITRMHCIVGDIWIRDWAPLLCSNGNEVVAVKFQYPDTYPYDAKTDNQAGIDIVKKLELPLVTSDIIWEMGNFTTNGTDIVVTDQVLDANGFADGDELHYHLVNDLNFDPALEIHILKVNEAYGQFCELLGFDKKQAICHIDGIMRFLNERTIIYHLPYVGDKLRQSISEIDSLFPNDWDSHKRKKYLNVLSNIRDTIKDFVTKHKSMFRFIPICSNHDYPVMQQISEEKGTITDDQDYINFLRYGQKLFLPFYKSGVEMLDNNNALKKYNSVSEIEMIPVNQRFVDDLAKSGGVLNCVSWIV